jgi:acetyl-CoA carboxylase carboxyl transferase subunit beta
MAPRSAAEFIQALVDARSFVRWPTQAEPTPTDASYAADLRRARDRSGVDESIVTGRAMIGGEPVALIVGEFGFLGGSIGREAARRIVAGLRRATRERLPVLAAPCSGGIRMQEGTPAFVELVEISRAVLAHQAAGLPYLVHLRNPTTGGVFASWASLGHVTWAEPGALIGFLGPRVVEALRGSALPDDVQRAENLAAAGVIDAVVATQELPARMAALLRALRPPTRRPVPRQLGESSARRPSGWASVLASRHPDRPGVRELLDQVAENVIALSGTGAGERTDAISVALASFDGEPSVVIGQDRRGQAEERVGPAALRCARRGMRLAQQLGLPVIAVVDTPGAELSPQAEAGALAGEIARCVAEFLSLTVPSVSILLGQGGGGAALALLPARRVIAAEHAWLAPLPPEGAAALACRDVGRAAELARRQHIGAGELLTRGIVAHVVPEPVPAHLDPIDFLRRIALAGSYFLRQQQDDAPMADAAAS